MKPVTLLVWFLLLGGCVSDLPRTMRDIPTVDIRPAQALSEAERQRGSPVRWGGAIASIENRREETWLEIVERPSSSSDKPLATDQSGGRFLARVTGFLDPAVYAPERIVTVIGALEEPVTRTIGDFPYRYPVVQVRRHYLWPRVPPNTPHLHPYPPYWTDPWYPWRHPPRRR